MCSWLATTTVSDKKRADFFKDRIPSLFDKLTAHEDTHYEVTIKFMEAYETYTELPLEDVELTDECGNYLVELGRGFKSVVAMDNFQITGQSNVDDYAGIETLFDRKDRTCAIDTWVLIARPLDARPFWKRKMEKRFLKNGAC